jgi:starvation-inducible DNA-binding protein
MQPNIGLDEEVLCRVVAALQQLLSDETALAFKTRSFQWNMEGFHALQIQQLLQRQYEELNAVLNDVAERVRVLGGHTLSSIQEASLLSRLPATPVGQHNGAQMLVLLLCDHEVVIKGLRILVEVLDDLGDSGSKSFVTGVLRQHETLAWTLRTHAS